MKDFKLTEILSTFTMEEMRRFKKFVESPYHNGSENVSNFFKEVIKFYPDFSNKNYNLKHIHGKLFPEKRYHDGVIRNLSSDLYKLAENFLVTDNILKEEIDYDINLLKQFKKRDLIDLFNINYKKSKAKLGTNKKDDIYFYNLYQLERELASLFDIERKTGKKHEEFVKRTADNANLLTKFFLTRILTSYCSIVSNAVDFKIKPELIFYNEIKHHIEKYKYDDTPIIQLYFDSLKLSLGNENGKVFEKIHSVLKKNVENLSHDDLHILYINLLNYTIIKKHYKLCLEIIKEILSGEYYSRKAEIMYMEYGFYSAAVHTAIYLKEYDWIEKFIKNYYDKLYPPQRDNAHYYHSALLEFTKKNFEKSLELLSNLNPSDFFLLIYTQRLRLAIYYELARTEEIYYLIDSYKHTLSRHIQIEDRFKKSGKDFIENFLVLVKLNEKFDPHLHSKLKDKITNQEGTTVFKEWFLEKLNQIKC